jgi:hypothetical protein
MRKEDSARHALFLIVVDLLFTFFIFVTIAALCKTLVDPYFLIPLLHKYGSISVYSIGDISITIDPETSLIVNVLVYYLTMIKQVVLSVVKVVEHPSQEYWYFSLVVEGSPVYWMPTSTMWATTHLASIFIYVYLALWFGATRLVIFRAFRMPSVSVIHIRKMVLRLNFNSNEYPITIIAINVIFYIGIFYALGQAWNLAAVNVE